MKVSEKMLEFEYELYEVQPAGGLLLGDNGGCQHSGSDMVPEQLVRFESRKILQCPHPRPLPPQVPEIIVINIRKVVVQAFDFLPPVY